ncbi:MAG: PLDc_N domain-containing protein [Flavobacteriaceae bacterium]|nr:PLDc_N domain-containing protein [Flavobacteriaceae bacterium]
MHFLGFIGPWQIILLLLFFILPIIALIDVIKSEFEGNNKLIWVLVILFFNFIGSILYFIIGAKQKVR